MFMRSKVLVVDDDSNVLSILSRYFDKYGWRTILANNGTVGLKKFRENKDDIGLIITDMQMPVMSGEQFINEINSIDPDVPMIIFSGTGLDFSHLKSISNVKDVVQKPINFNHFHILAKQHFVS